MNRQVDSIVSIPTAAKISVSVVIIPTAKRRQSPNVGPSGLNFFYRMPYPRPDGRGYLIAPLRGWLCQPFESDTTEGR